MSGGWGVEGARAVQGGARGRQHGTRAVTRLVRFAHITADCRLPAAGDSLTAAW